jgi:N-acetylglucosaminyldiphosphoundecaprenol N-acetyl-beta-D-mannosaminyltransferase
MKDRALQAKTIRFLGLRLHCMTYEAMFAKFDEWIGMRDRPGRSVALINVNCCASGLLHRDLRLLYQDADYLAIDSMPFAYLARLLVDRRTDSMYGPDMIRKAAQEAPKRGYRFFLYGGPPGTAEALGEALQKISPELEIAGTRSHPFRETTTEEDDAICRTIAASVANMVWVGLGQPKQDVWIERCRERLPGCVLIGVGAAFDFLTGRVRQAPRFVRNLGLEWLFRLTQDPMRLWKRYTVYNVLFVGALALELLGILRLSNERADG